MSKVSRMSSSRTPRSAVALVAALLAVLPVAAGARQGGETFFESVDVEVVNVEVHVTDREGRPVTGLGPEDFRVEEDGRPVEITNFYEVRGGEPAPADGAAGVPGEAAAVPAPGTPPSEERRLHLIVYLDGLSLSARHRNRVLEELEALLAARVSAGDRVTVATSHPGLEVRLPFTEDREEVLSAVRELAGESASLSMLAAERRRIETAMERGAVPGSGAASAGGGLSAGAGAIDADLVKHLRLDIRSYAERMIVEVRREVRNLEALVGSLTGLPGRKAVVHVSEGLPERPGQDLYNRWQATFGGGVSTVGGALLETDEFDVTRHYLDLVREANASGVTFYTLDAVGGDRMGSTSTAATRGMGAGGARTGGPELEAFATVNQQNPLRLIANGTGGVPILGASRPGVELARLAERSFDTYYSLGYRMPAGEAGTYRKIDVEVTVPGARVRHRAGYRENTLSTRIENRTVAALLHDAWANPLRVFVDVGQEDRRKRKRYLVPIRIKIPLDQVTLLPMEADHRGRLKARVAFRDGDGRFGLSEEMTVPLVIPNGEAGTLGGRHYTLTLDLELAPGPHRLAVGVFDEVGGEASYLPYDLYVGET